MCLAIPGKVIKIEEKRDFALVDVNGVRQRANVTLLPDIKKGDYILLHVGFGIEIIDRKRAEETLKIWRGLI